jgi:hypothetical protein
MIHLLRTYQNLNEYTGRTGLKQAADQIMREPGCSNYSLLNRIEKCNEETYLELRMQLGRDLADALFFFCPDFDGMMEDAGYPEAG